MVETVPEVGTAADGEFMYGWSRLSTRDRRVLKFQQSPIELPGHLVIEEVISGSGLAFFTHWASHMETPNA